ncbi:ATP phosphoribosyltransferase regulatory subunit [Meinhardsimonia xiamenensis]|jgi:ATP phosphoribosyltransferase regulatory subunit|uniref:Histidine--tRNA ligase n=1 Tax=Meinhardsimonia xiamenensis TaxID=990712 RepID=A0A1G8Y5N7_9RHOB|nr:ATP phosphoribosyltransferase regulatory subunit [Meinhardsimonia xiamenensis]PRX37153.1 ATP phosphoribosyltransferase regulatory subunit [Meinhardsimonia xiamenensis]SDJ97390.1 ATP phosphoribosyltransferase regulatory subunit [Meinhardsimonia xiamenensis]
MIPLADRPLDAEIARILRLFDEAGAVLVDLPVLLPAERLLDLYGEDIRARAYTTRDPEAGELMLRPDFTVPVVDRHMASGAEPARYSYAGKVFRVQEPGSNRPPEYDQVGFELLGADDPAAADAEVFALIARALAHLGLRAAMGDMALLRAAVTGLKTSAPRKAALLRHLWRPRRFRALLDRYGGVTPVPPARAALVAAAREGRDLLKGAGPAIGLRTREEVRERIAALVADAEEPPISEGERALLDELLGLKAKAPAALTRLRDLAVDMAAIEPAVNAVARRLEALAARGVDVEALDFEGSYGRTSLEYYDGFVFGFYAEARPDLPPVATGGRYDALTRALGGGRAIPAVGGVIRPALSLALAEPQREARP